MCGAPGILHILISPPPGLVSDPGMSYPQQPVLLRGNVSAFLLIRKFVVKRKKGCPCSKNTGVCLHIVRAQCWCQIFSVRTR